MAQENVYPVYLIAGFLDSGKTSFINGILSDGFAMDDRTMLLCCEEGETEYDRKLLRNVTVVTVDDQETLTPEFLETQRKKCRHVADSGLLCELHATELGALSDHRHRGRPYL